MLSLHVCGFVCACASRFVAEIEYDAKNETVTFKFAQAVAKGLGDLRIEYTGTLFRRIILAECNAMYISQLLSGPTAMHADIGMRVTLHTGQLNDKMKGFYRSFQTTPDGSKKVIMVGPYLMVQRLTVKMVPYCLVLIS